MEQSDKAHRLLNRGAFLLDENNKDCIDLLLEAAQLFEKTPYKLELNVSLKFYFDALKKFSEQPVEKYRTLFEKYRSTGIFNEKMII